MGEKAKKIKKCFVISKQIINFAPTIVHRVECGERNPVIFSKLEGTEIWEFRTLYNKVKYRLFAFWDTQSDTLVIATHGIIKKTQKTPKKEISKAERIRQEYFNAKK